MKLRSRSSRATGPKMRVPRGFFWRREDGGVLVEARCTCRRRGRTPSSCEPPRPARPRPSSPRRAGGPASRADDDVADSGVAATRAAADADAQDLAGAGVVGHLETRLLLDHRARSRTSTRRQRLVRLRGRLSITRTVSPTCASFLSSCACSVDEVRTIFRSAGAGARCRPAR